MEGINRKWLMVDWNELGNISKAEIDDSTFQKEHSVI